MLEARDLDDVNIELPFLEAIVDAMRGNEHNLMWQKYLQTTSSF